MPKLRAYGFMIREETFCNDPCLVIRVMAREDGAAFPINPRSEGEDAIWDAPKRNDDMMMSDLVARMYASDYGVHRGDFEFLQPWRPRGRQQVRVRDLPNMREAADASRPAGVSGGGVSVSRSAVGAGESDQRDVPGVPGREFQRRGRVMGTRRSKHNKGVKPLYKEHRMNLVDLGAGAVDAFNVAPSGEKQPRMSRRRKSANIAEPPRPAPRARPTVPPAPLVAEVEAFLARRAEAQADRAAAQARVDALNADTVKRPERVQLPAYSVPTVAVSPNDIVAQLFFDRSISPSQARAARIWQKMMHAATLQPSHCVDWSEPVQRSFRYQRRGDATDRQIDAMEFRNAIIAEGGASLASALDALLDFDVGIRGFTQRHGMSAGVAKEYAANLLSKLCDSALAVAGTTDVAPTFWRAADASPDRVPFLRASKTLPHHKTANISMR